MKKISFLFSGQGSQYVGMCKKLYDEFDVVKRTFNEANDAVGFDLKKLCFEGSLNELSKTENTQAAILTTSIAQLRTYMDVVGINPDFLAGHSVGEYAALVCAEVINFHDALKLVSSRGKFMQEAAVSKKGTMIVVRNIDVNTIEQEIYMISLKGMIINISNYNGINNIVISGEEKAIELISERLIKKGAEVIKLNVNGAFHSKMMEEASVKLKEELKKYSFNDPKFKVISNVTALPYEDGNEIANILAEQITEPVKWQSIMEYMKKKGANTLIEFGPKSVLRNIAKNNMHNIKAYSYDKVDDFGQIKEHLSNSKKNKYSIIDRSLGIAVCTRNYNWNSLQYKIGVIEPYKNVEKLQQQLHETGKEPTIQQMVIAIDMLKSVFHTKKTPQSERIQRFTQLLDETSTWKYIKELGIDTEF